MAVTNGLRVGDPPEGELKGRYAPNCWERFLTGQILCPCCGCCSFFLLGILFTILFIFRAYKEGDKLFLFDELPVKSDPIVQAWYAFDEARGEKVKCSNKKHEDEATCRSNPECSWNNITSACGDISVCIDTAPKRPRSIPVEGQRGKGSTWIIFLYEAQNGGNLLDDDMLGYIRKFEKTLLTTANGAKNKKGELSPWDQDWCFKKYPANGNSSAAGRCAPVINLVGLFTMTAAGRAAVASQVAEGYSNMGSLGTCMCSHADTLCGVCTVQNGEGQVLPFNLWPASMMSCIQAETQQMNQAGGAGTNQCGNSVTNMMTNMAAMQGAFASFCKSKPSCQWSPSDTHTLCSSTGFFASDWQGLVTGTDKDSVLDNICDENKTGWWNVRKQVLHQSFDCSVRKAKYARTTFYPGNPDPSTKAYEDFEQNYIKGRNGWYQQATKLEQEIEKESGGKLRIILYSQATIRSQFMGILINDMMLSLLSMFMVWAYMWWTLESIFLASCAMFEIVFSVPVALFVWTTILQQQVLFVQLLVVYMILGIGADDAFILYDAWLQARFRGEEVMGHWSTRFAYAYRKSFHAMAITTATTCGSFVIGAFSPLPMVKDFCIFAAVVVLVDWLFCISFFASAVVVYERMFRNPVKKPGECCGEGCCWGCCRFSAASLCGKRCVDVDADPNVPRKRGMEKFCEGPLFNFLQKWRFLLLFLWLVIVGGASTIAGLNLRIATKVSPVGRESLDTTRGIEILMAEFSWRGAPEVNFVWGIDVKQPVSGWDGLIATPQYGSTGSITTPQGQQELLRLCRASDLGDDAVSTRCDGRKCIILGKSSTGRCPRNENQWRKNGVYIPDDVLCTNGRHCFMEDFAEWWAATKDDCQNKTETDCIANAGCSWHPASGRAPGLCYSTTSPDSYPGLPETEFLQKLLSKNFTKYRDTKDNVLRSEQRNFEVSSRRSMTGWTADGNGGLKLAWVGFNGTIPRQNSLDEANTWYDRWEAFRTTHGPNLGGFQSTEVYKFMVTQREMVLAALMGVGLSLLISYIVLMLTTMNWWVTTLGMVNIVAIAATFLGVMPLLGWSLGENECIFLIAVVGLSIDYTVHLLHSYNGGTGGRDARARHALGEMGISVTNSAATTLLAAVILFGCGFYFFFQFGGFIFFVIGFSIIASITFLIPLLLVAGPGDGAGDFCCRKRKAEAPPDLQLDEIK